MANNVLHAQIICALQCVRTARFDGDLELIDAAEQHLDSLIERLEPKKVPAPA